MKYILSIDQGTTGTTAFLIDAKSLSIIGSSDLDFKQIYPKPSWVEHDLNDIWNSVEVTIQQLFKKYKISPNQISTIGITNQRETTTAFNKKGIPLHNAIVWQDRRTQDFCKSIISHQAVIKEKTGLTIDPYFSASKMNWLLNNCEAVKNAYSNNDLLMGTIDTYLLYKLSGCTSFKTEPSNASRTMLMNLKSSNWDAELLNIFNIKESILPEISESMSMFGVTKGLDFLPDGIPITGILGDQQAALFGQAGFDPGSVKCTYGTGAFILFNTGRELKYSNEGLLTTTFYKYKNQTFYALEGSTYIAGAAIQWLRDNLKIISEAKEVESLALQVNQLNELEHLLFFPFFTGLGAPYWKSEAKATITGLTRDTANKHLGFVALEGIALSINDLLIAMKKDTQIAIHELKVDGGASQNNLLMTLQATFSHLNIIRPKNIESTAAGAAYAAAIGANLLSIDEIKNLWQKDSVYTPSDKYQPYCQKKANLWQSTIRKLYL